jgi:energy-coupling factor transport system ATP-binding protein
MRMLAAMPSAMRIFSGLNIQDRCPLTVKEGRLFLERHYGGIKSDLRENPEKPSEKLFEKRYKNPSESLHDTPNGKSILKVVKYEEMAINLKEVWFRYERQLPDILKGTALAIRRGEIFAVLGENGSGKTTLLRVVSGQNRAYRGKVEIGGRKIQSYSGRQLYRSNIAFLPQDPQPCS